MELFSIIGSALVAGLFSLAVCLINNHYNIKALGEKQTAQMNDMIAHNEEAIAIMQCSIDELRKEVEKHNRIVERVFVLEGQANNLYTITNNTQQDIKDLKKDLDRIADKV